MRYIYYFLTIPAHLIGCFFLVFNAFNFKEKLHKCIQVIDTRRMDIPDSFTPYLIAAEDHRSPFHYGVVHIGMLRALFCRIFNGKNQGASTIEQQFVRVVTGDYSHSIIRKLKEQMLAILLTKTRSKKDIAKAYLAIAYYGHNCVGTKGIESILGNSLQQASEKQIILIVARLKYPKPSNKVVRWERKIHHRALYIKARHQRATNKSRHRILRTAA